MSSVEKTLQERGERYGDFTDHAAIAQCLQDGMRLTRPNGWERLSDVQRQALTAIADKIARILSGDPNYADNWRDIQGYARLVEERLPAMVAVRNQSEGRAAGVCRRGNRLRYAITPDGLCELHQVSDA